jgi:hypothetical protein
MAERRRKIHAPEVACPEKTYSLETHARGGFLAPGTADSGGLAHLVGGGSAEICGFEDEDFRIEGAAAFEALSPSRLAATVDDFRVALAALWTNGNGLITPGRELPAPRFATAGDFERTGL